MTSNVGEPLVSSRKHLMLKNRLLIDLFLSLSLVFSWSIITGSSWNTFCNDVQAFPSYSLYVITELGLMQRLSSWFEQLPLRRRSSTRRSENCGLGPHKQQSKSAAPRLRYSVSAAQNYRHRDHSVDVLSQSLISNDQPHGTYFRFFGWISCKNLIIK